MFPIKILIQNCLHLIKTLIFYILQFELKKLVKSCGFSSLISKDSVFDKKTARTSLIHCTIPKIIQDMRLFK